DVHAFEEALKKAGKQVYKIREFKAGHGFMRPSDSPDARNPAYREGPAKEAWQDVDQFFAKTLGGKGSGAGPWGRPAACPTLFDGTAMRRLSVLVPLALLAGCSPPPAEPGASQAAVVTEAVRYPSGKDTAEALLVRPGG